MGEKFKNYESIEQNNQNTNEIPGLSPEKLDLIKQEAGDNFDAFSSIINSGVENEIITQEQKDITLYILEGKDIQDLKFFFQFEGFNLVDDNGIEDFINSPEFTKTVEKYYKEQNLEKEEQNLEKEVQNLEKEVQELNNFKESYRNTKDILFSLSENNQELSIIVNKLDLINNGVFEYNGEIFTLESVRTELALYLEKDNNAQELFSQLQDDPKSYEALYSFLSGLGDSRINTTLQSIPKTASEFSQSISRAGRALESSKTDYFPGASQGEVERRGNLLIQSNYNGDFNKIIDFQTQPPRSYIE